MEKWLEKKFQRQRKDIDFLQEMYDSLSKNDLFSAYYNKYIDFRTSANSTRRYISYIKDEFLIKKNRSEDKVKLISVSNTIENQIEVSLNLLTVLEEKFNYLKEH
jgi:hypothetical protein